MNPNKVYWRQKGRKEFNYNFLDTEQGRKIKFILNGEREKEFE